MRKAEVIPVVIRALGIVTKHFEKMNRYLLGTSTVIQKVFDVKWEKNEAPVPNTTGGCPLW